MFLSANIFLVALSLVGPSLSANVHFQMTVSNAPVAPDGFNRSSVLVNGKFPGPVITARKGDRLLLNVKNELTDPTMRRSTSIHWHGLFQHRTAEADGPAFVTQCPIAPRHNFLYNIPLNEQTGTFWYHSHLSSQYCDGLRGALVIYDPDDPHKHLYNVDDESTIITLADWYHTPAPEAQANYFSTGNVPNPDSGTINGVGRFNGGPQKPFAIVNVRAGNRYRLRVINMGCRPFHSFSIDGHKLTIIEADGISHEPLEVDQFDIYAAQRYSVVLKTNQPIGNYWIRAPLTGGSEAQNPNLNATFVRAILRYAGARAVEPTTNGTTTDRLVEENLHALVNPGSPGGDVPADVNLTLTLGRDPTNATFFTVNGQRFESPSVPTLLQILNGSSEPSDFLPSENTFILPRNKIIQVTIPGGGQHPFHLHGHAFDVIRTSGSNTTNFKNPPRRDVVAVNGGNMTFRFLTDNPGPWMLHCHIEWHIETGLAVIFGEAPEAIVRGNQSQTISPAWKKLCPIYENLDPAEQ